MPAACPLPRLASGDLRGQGNGRLWFPPTGEGASVPAAAAGRWACASVCENTGPV